MISSILFTLAAIISLFATWLIVAALRFNEKANAYQNRITFCLAASITLILVAVLQEGLVGDQGLRLTLVTVAGFTTLLVQNLYLIGIWQHGVRGLGLFLLPLTAIPLLALPWLPDAQASQWIAANSFLATGHLLLSLAGYAVLTVAALYAAMQLLLDRALRLKNIGFVVRAMPSLMDIDNHLFAHVRWAIWLIGLSILTGLSWQWLEMEHFALFNHKVLLAVFAWCALMVLYYLRKKAVWHHQLASKMVLFAYVALMLAYFGVKLIQNIA
ncbi:MAG: cytochrome c biogenesis protein CcsA [Ghiorsea sp.]